VVVGSDFYPFGLVMDGTEITDEAYRYGYQGQFSEKDLTTGWNEFELRMYDARFGRWLSVDPYGQYASGYVGMGNSPGMGVDPDGGFNLGATAVGAVGGFAVGSLVGLAVDKDNWWKYGIGGAVIGGTIGAMQPDLDISESASGLTEFRAEVEHTLTGKSGGVWDGNNYFHYAAAKAGPTANISAVVKHGTWNPGNSDWGKHDGHVFLIVNGVDYSFRPTPYRNGVPLPPTPPASGNKNLWSSDGRVGSSPGYLSYARSVAHSEYTIRTTLKKKRALMDNINKSALSPPKYKFVGTRCASWAMRMMRKSDIVPRRSRLHQFSPLAF
jgi:RHS repeat-associated protein